MRVPEKFLRKTVLPSQKRKRSGRREKDQARPLDWEEANSTVVEVFPKLCRVRTDLGNDIVCGYRRATVFQHPEVSGFRERTPVTVGDRALVEATTSAEGTLAGLCPRKNRLYRRSPGRERIIQVLGANLDLVVVVASVQRPGFYPGLVDRFLISAQHEGINAIICLTKMDLWEEGSQEIPWSVYVELGIPIFKITTRKDCEDLENLRSAIAGKNTIFCGLSGVGKTSLLSKLMGVDAGRVGEVSESSGRGVHTTTGAIGFTREDNSLWIDTPGVREFDLVGVKLDDLPFLFPEFRKANCEMQGCWHDMEPGCKAKDLPRHGNYHKLLMMVREES